MAKKKRQSKASVKGKLLETIVASLHDTSGVKVERNVRLPTVRNPRRKREIDVLITGYVAGYPVRIAIECKNYKAALDVPYIDAFIGKLQDVGIPLQHGIYISPCGFTEGAIERSQEVGITPLLLVGLTPDRLAEKINKAIQSVVYLLLEITELTINASVERTDNSFQLWFLYNQEKKIQGAIPDLVWREWIKGTLPSELGEHEIDVEIPHGWQPLVDGKLETINYVKAKIRIIGIVLTVHGKATQHILVDPIEKKVDRFKTHVSFDTSERKIPVTTFLSDEDIDVFLKQQPEPVKIMIGRFRLPRIKYYALYWPSSARAVNELVTLVAQCQKEERKLSDEELLQIEGSDLSTLWDPIWEENPILKTMPPHNPALS